MFFLLDSNLAVSIRNVQDILNRQGTYDLGSTTIKIFIFPFICYHLCQIAFRPCINIKCRVFKKNVIASFSS